jgi:Major royal jelly protein
MRSQSLALCLVLGALIALQTAFVMAKPDAVLIPVVSSREIAWNAVVTDENRIFVAGPRWADGTGPAVAVFDRKGYAHPYPSAAWNGWKPGADTIKTFVSVNALHRDDHGGLWVIDTGAPNFGSDAVPAGAKAVRFNLATNRLDRIYPLGPQVVLSGSYIDDIRFHGDHAYLTDAGRPGLLVLDLKTGATRRVLDGAQATTAPPDRPIIVDGKV